VKTEGVLEKRALSLASKGWPALLVITLIGLPATVIARPNSLENYRGHPFLFMVPVAVIASIATVVAATLRHSAFVGFLAAYSFLTTMLVGAAAGLFPVLLPSVGDQGRNITIAAALAGPNTIR